MIAHGKLLYSSIQGNSPPFPPPPPNQKIYIYWDKISKYEWHLNQIMEVHVMFVRSLYGFLREYRQLMIGKRANHKFSLI